MGLDGSGPRGRESGAGHRHVEDDGVSAGEYGSGHGPGSVPCVASRVTQTG